MNKQEMITQLKEQYLVLRTGDDNVGYTDLSPEEYEITISNWADAELAKLAAEAEAEAKESKRIAALAKLEALGLDEDDLKALEL